MKRSTRYRIFYLLSVAGVTAGTRERVWKSAASGLWSEARAQQCVDWLDTVVLDPRYFPGVPEAVIGKAMKLRIDNERE